MANVIDMQDLRNLSLFRKITQISTRYSFKYNEILMFCVPKKLISKALGRNGENLKRMSDILKKRIRIIPLPKGVENAKEFIQAILAPVEFQSMEITPDEIVITAGSQSKAALLGRNKRRLLEMQKIVSNFFGSGYRII